MTTVSVWGQSPGAAKWIWHHDATDANRPAGETCFFRRTFSAPAKVKRADIRVTADNHFELFLNGVRIGQGADWTKGERIDVAGMLRHGNNVLAARAWNDGGPAAFMLFMDIEEEGGYEDGKRRRVETDAGWWASFEGTAGWKQFEFDEAGAGWKRARVYAGWNDGIWRNVTFPGPSRFDVPAGFRVTEVARGFGSVIAMSRGAPSVDKGKILDGGLPRPKLKPMTIFCGIERGGIRRLRDTDGDGRFERIEVYCDDVESVQGMCFDDGALWVTGRGSKGNGFYRIDDKTRKAERIAGFTSGGGEHGPHAVVRGPDNHLWITLGNHVWLDQPVAESSPYRHYDEGHLLSRFDDPRGHARGMLAPAGTILRFDPKTRTWELFAGGFRNVYDIAFDNHGELFAWDADMEWDIGLPWYRPVRLDHVVPGGEYGWRTGSSKWPSWYPDMVPPVIEVGRGSPTGLLAYRSKDSDVGFGFPKRYDGAFLAGDWAQGRILAFFCEPDGKSYRGRWEVLISGRPLNVTDLIQTRDGVLFSTGGRGTRGAVYRLSHVDPREPDFANGEGRREVESLDDDASVNIAVTPSLTVERLLHRLTLGDRVARYEARRLLEDIPVAKWEEPALTSRSALARSEALVGLARIGRRTSNDTDDIRRRLEVALRIIEIYRIGVETHGCLRAVELMLGDSDFPAIAIPKDVGRRLLAVFPTKDRPTNRGLVTALAHLQPDGTIEALLAHLEFESSRAEQIHVAYGLRCCRRGWSDEAKIRFGKWVADASTWAGGFSFLGYVDAIRRDFEKLLTAKERDALFAKRATVSKLGRRLPSNPTTSAPPRDFDRTFAFLEQRLAHRYETDDLREGARVFAMACGRCHAFGAAAGGVGPDLETTFRRFTMHETLEAIVEPSRTISDQYRSTVVYDRRGGLETGMLIRDDASGVRLLLSSGEQVLVPREHVERREPSTISAMPTGLIDSLTLEEVAALFAFMQSESPEAVAASKASASEPQGAADEVKFFDGDLDGWTFDEKLWCVDNGVVIGQAQGLTRSSFLVAPGIWDDFELELEIRVTAGNSGIQLRSDVVDGHLVGYQADAAPEYWGSLYEEGDRGMLVQARPEVWRPAVEITGWNHYRIVAVEDRLRLFVNGVETVDLTDDRRRRGRIGFQLHSGKETRVALRRLRMRRR